MKEDKTCKNFSPATYATCSSCTIDGKYTSCSGNKEKCKYILMEKKNEIKRLIDFVEPREERITEFEKENAELKEKVSYLEDNLRVARKNRENLQLDVAKGLKEFVKDYPATSLRYLANEKYVEQLTKAKELIEELSSSLSVVGECGEEECELLNRAEQFLKDSEVEK